jgi:hypothetical protein
MKQHLFRGRGDPDFVPTGYSHMYLDLDTGNHWLSKGIFDASDWVGPYATAASVRQAIDDYAAGISDLADKVVQYVEVVNYPNRGRYATIDPTIHHGKFIIIRDLDPRLEVTFKIEILPTGRTLLGSQIWLYNDSVKTTSVDNYNCMVNYPLGQTDKTLEYKGVMIVRPLELNGGMFTYLLSGTMNSTIDAPSGDINAIDAEHRADNNNPHEVDKDQIGLGNVQNYSMATLAEARLGELATRYMGPVSVKAAIAEQALKPLSDHVNDTENPHLVDKYQIELGSVMNYPMALDVDGVYAGEFDVELTTDKLYASPRTIRLALERYKEMNPALVNFCSTVDAQMAGRMDLLAIDNETVSPFRLAQALIEYTRNLSWSTNQNIDTAFSGGEVDNSFIGPEALIYALDLLKQDIANSTIDNGDNGDLSAVLQDLIVEMTEVLGMLVTINYVNAPQDLVGKLYTALPDIKTEYFVTVNRELFGQYNARTDTWLDCRINGAYGNYGVFEPQLSLPMPMIEGATLGPYPPLGAEGYALTHTASGVQLINGTWEYDYSFDFGDGLADVSVLPPLVDIVWPHTTTISGRYDLLWIQGGEPFQMYAGFRPMGGVTEEFTFIDNMGMPGGVGFHGFSNSILTDIKPPKAFSGFIKRTALGKKAAELVDADVVCGMLVVGTSAKFITNGIVRWERTGLPVGHSEYSWILNGSFMVNYNSVVYNGIAGINQLKNTGVALDDIFNNLQILVSQAWASGDYGDYTANQSGFIDGSTVNNVFPVNLANAVMAILQDDPHRETEASDLAGEYGQGDIRLQCYPWEDTEVLSGYFYLTP